MSPPPGRQPAAEMPIDQSLATTLLRHQHPDLAALPFGETIEGWDNVTFRLGEELALRLPRRRAAADLIAHEQRWLPRLAPHLPLPIPVPLRVGRPAAGYPWAWSVVPWLPGRSALRDPLLPSQAIVLGEFLAALHNVAAFRDAPRNPYRGVPLAERMEGMAARLDQLHTVSPASAPDPDRLAEIAAQAAAAPPAVTPVWLHGDLHAKNVISCDGTIGGIVDWGDVCIGDRATDLAAAWILFEPSHHAALRTAYGGVSDATWLRARGWAIMFGLMLWGAHCEAEPAFADLGLMTLRRAAV